MGKAARRRSMLPSGWSPVHRTTRIAPYVHIATMSSYPAEWRSGAPNRATRLCIVLLAHRKQEMLPGDHCQRINVAGCSEAGVSGAATRGRRENSNCGQGSLCRPLHSDPVPSVTTEKNCRLTFEACGCRSALREGNPQAALAGDPVDQRVNRHCCFQA